MQNTFYFLLWSVSQSVQHLFCNKILIQQKQLRQKNTKKTKLFGINTKVITQSFHLFRFQIWFFLCLRKEVLTKFIVMQKQLRVISKTRLAVCPFSKSLFPVPTIPLICFSKHLNRLGVHYNPLPGVKVYQLNSIGWFIWVYPSGFRQLNALPF